MYDQNRQIQSLIGEAALRRATCWKIEPVQPFSAQSPSRPNVYLTDHDVSITIAGNKYKPAGGGASSALQSESGIKAQSIDISGIMDSDEFTDEDFRIRLYDDAKITQYVVDSLYPWQGFIEENVFYVGNTEFTDEIWKVELSGLVSLLQKRIGRITGKECPYIYGNTKCGDNPQVYGAFAVATVVYSRSQFLAATYMYDDDYDDCMLEWISGDNCDAGVVSHIKRYYYTGGPNGNREIILYNKTPYPIEVSDTFFVHEKCDRDWEACKGKSNSNNFGGEPHLPGEDKMIRGPDTN